MIGPKMAEESQEVLEREKKGWVDSEAVVYAGVTFFAYGGTSCSGNTWPAIL